MALLARNHRGFVLAMSAVARQGEFLDAAAQYRILRQSDRRGVPPRAAVGDHHDSEFAELVSDATANRRAISPTARAPTSNEPTTLAALAAAYPTVRRRAQTTPARSPSTSGTTGTPKGARGAISGGGSIPTLEAPAALLDRIPLQDRDAGLAAPAFHAWGLSNLLLGLGLGCTFVCVRKFDPEQWLAAIAEHDDTGPWPWYR